MKILITGTNGYIGKNLKEYFQDKYKDLYCPKRQELDLLDSQAVYEYLTGNKFDVVIHCGVTLLSVEQNLKMYFNLERCSRFFGKMLCVGSGAEYDTRHYIPKMKEEYFGTHIPLDIYGFSKYVIAKDIECRHRNIYNLRVFGIFGKYENYRRRFISNNICRVLSGLNLSIKKNMYFDYLYVNDFSKIVGMFINKEAARRSYNICTGKSIDLLTLAEIIKKVDGRKVPIDIQEEGLGVEYTGDNELFLQEFGEFNFTPPEKAINELYQWYRDSSNIAFNAKDFE
jgi:GDP-L-fucose synthase